MAEIQEQVPKKRGRKPGQKNKVKKTTKKKNKQTNQIETQLVGELLIINLNGKTIKKVILVGGGGKESLEIV